MAAAKVYLFPADDQTTYGFQVQTYRPRVVDLPDDFQAVQIHWWGWGSPRAVGVGHVIDEPHNGYISLGDWTNREWYPALEAAGIAKRGPYSLRHTFATEAIANGINPYELAEVMGTSVAMIDRHYGHLRADAHDRIRRLLEGRA